MGILVDARGEQISRCWRSKSGGKAYSKNTIGREKSQAYARQSQGQASGAEAETLTK
jgi:hypothetical protein